ncbi:MAG: hypothetical protein LC648_00930 [Novosphingobium sp.]|nr:hypothetical protein [Novosphingobium sp.]
MTSAAFPAIREGEVESRFAAGLAAAERTLAGVSPTLRGLLASDDPALFSDRLVAQVRGQLEDLAWRLVEAGGPANDDATVELADRLISEPTLVRHAHALALEFELAERLAARLSLDPVLPPLLQARIASPDPETAATAKDLIAAQARFVQAQRRGELAPADLPGELLDAALSLGASAHAGADEPANRLALLERVAADVGGEALDLTHAGGALFVTALARAAGIDRDAAVLVTAEAQAPRLALILLAGGARPAAIERTLFALHPDFALPEGFASLSAERAAALLAGAGGPAPA